MKSRDFLSKRLCWLFCILQCAIRASASTFSNTTQIKEGILRYHYDDSGDISHSCSAVLLLGVGTAMRVNDYDHIALEIAQRRKGVVVAIVDHAPGNPIKLSGKRYANLVNFVAAKVDDLIPICRQNGSQKTHSKQPKFIVGGHSASGEAAMKSLAYLEGVSPAGFIGLSPYRITKRLPQLSIPSLFWGFSKTTCGVQIGYAADMAYNLSSVQNGRVLYQLQNPTGQPRHCIFANHGCPVCPCSPSEEHSWIRPAVGDSIAKYLNAIETGTPFTPESMSLSLPHNIGREHLQMFVGGDTVEIPHDKEWDVAAADSAIVQKV